MSDAIELALQAYNVGDEVKKSLAERGISIIPKPKYESIDGVDLTEDGEPIVPSDITSLTLKDIGTLSGVCSSYLAFLGTQVAWAEMEVAQYENLRDLIKATIRSEVDGRKTDKDDIAMKDPRYIRINADYVKANTILEISKIKYKQYESNLRLLSREITRRGVEAEQEKVGNNFDRRFNRMTGRNDPGVPK